MRNPLPAGLVALFLVTSTMALRADVPKDFPDAKALVAAIQDKLKSVADYSLVADIQSPDREAVIDYRCIRPSDIRTEILDGSHRGTVIVFLPKVKETMVKVKSGNKRLWRSISKLKIAATPMVQSVLDTFASDLATYPLTMKTHQKVTIDVGKPVKVTSSNDPDTMGDEHELPPTSPDPPATSFPQERVEKDCYVLEGVKDNIRISLAVETSTLWPISIKRWKGRKAVYEAEIWRMTVNTSPKIDF